MRIVSLLPAATEIIAALDLLDQLVGVSHECDYPPAVKQKPRVTGCAIHGKDVASRDIDQWVSQTLAQGQDLFTLDAEKLRALLPDIILTQKLCDVCAPAYGSVAELARTLPGPPRVLNLEPATFDDILQNIQTVAEAVGVPGQGARAIAALQQRINAVRCKAEAAATRPRVAVIEWLDPVFGSGHWTPELVHLAGGNEVLGRPGADSVRLSWEVVARAAPELMVIACCGQSTARARPDWERARTLPNVSAIPAVKMGRVFLVDGNAYFSRPGPRIVDALEILATVIHPEIFAGAFPDRGMITFPPPDIA